MVVDLAVTPRICWVDITVTSVMEGQFPDALQKEHRKRASQGSALTLKVHWITNTTRGHGTLVFGLSSMPGTDAYK